MIKLRADFNEKPSKQDIEAWKEKHGDVFLITLTDKDEELEDGEEDEESGLVDETEAEPVNSEKVLSAYLIKPSRKVLSAATKMAKKADDPMKFNEVLVSNCMLGGDKVIAENDDLFLALCSKLDEIIVTKQAQIKKL